MNLKSIVDVFWEAENKPAVTVKEEVTTKITQPPKVLLETPSVQSQPNQDMTLVKNYTEALKNKLSTSPTNVPVGGSYVSNLADNLQAFGLNNGPNLFAATYNTFGKIVVQQYPNLVPSFPPVSEILDTSYVQSVASTNTLPTDNEEKITYSPTESIKTVEGRKDYSIQFKSGSAEILPSSFSVLDGVADEIVITKYAVSLRGHTDQAKWTGMTPEQSSSKNEELSLLRANAVKAYLQKKGQFPDGRIRTYGLGQEEPVADNSTEAGRAKNRRVQIVLGNLN